MRIAAAALLVLVAGAMVSAPAEAHHSRVTVGVGFGFGYPFWGPYWSPWYYPPPYAYYPAPIVVRSEPVTYIEQASPQATERGNWWYYCDTTRGYYPYVRECPAGWQRVPPAPPPPR